MLMMGTFKDFIDYVAKLFTWWVTVQPWEQGLRVRFGSRETVLKPGMHFRLPLIDIVYIQQDRPRIITLPVQTLTTKDGLTLTVNISIQYEISSIKDLFHSYYQPDHTIANLAMSAVSEYVATHNKEECTPMVIQEKANPDFNGKGLRSVSISVIGYAIVKTYRLIQGEGQGYLHDAMYLTKDFAVK